MKMKNLLLIKESKVGDYLLEIQDLLNDINEYKTKMYDLIKELDTKLKVSKETNFGITIKKIKIDLDAAINAVKNKFLK